MKSQWSDIALLKELETDCERGDYKHPVPAGPPARRAHIDRF
jgi:hypothetical protein